MACFVLLSDRASTHSCAALISNVAHTGCLIVHRPEHLLQEMGGYEGRVLLFVDLRPNHFDLLESLHLLGQAHFSGTLVFIDSSDARPAYSASVLARHFGLDVMRCIPAQPSEQDILSLLIDWEVRPPVLRRALRKTYSSHEIQVAIEKKQLVNYYQPKISLADHRFHGVELLARWEHPDDGLVFPDQFIGTAEDSPLIDELTLAVLDRGLADFEKWKSHNLEPELAINLSMESLQRPRFIDRLRRKLAHQCAYLPLITLEVTESRLMRDPLSTLSALTRLRLGSLILSIDDFGTGHASLAQLRDIPFDEIKIDRGFISDVHRNPIHQAIYQGILSMAKGMGIRTVAEGVETSEELDFLRKTGCDHAQGYLLARPMPADDIISFAKNA